MASSAVGLSSGIQQSIFPVSCRKPPLSSFSSLRSRFSRLTWGLARDLSIYLLKACQQLFKSFISEDPLERKALQPIFVPIPQAFLASFEEVQRRGPEYGYHFCKMVPIVVFPYRGFFPKINGHTQKDPRSNCISCYAYRADKHLLSTSNVGKEISIKDEVLTTIATFQISTL